jgi:hypothetical protein
MGNAAELAASREPKKKQQQNVGWGQLVVINIHARSGSQSPAREEDTK